MQRVIGFNFKLLLFSDKSLNLNLENNYRNVKKFENEYDNFFFVVVLL